MLGTWNRMRDSMVGDEAAKPGRLRGCRTTPRNCVCDDGQGRQPMPSQNKFLWGDRHKLSTRRLRNVR